MKGPTASGLTMRGIVKGTSVVGYCSLMDSRREEINLTSKFKMQGPNISKRIMATIGTKSWREARILFVPIPE
jgi:hypothetical protein